MNMIVRLILIFPLLGLWLGSIYSKAPLPPVTSFSVHVLTQHNNNSRTGSNLLERILTTENVREATFGKLFERSVDGFIHAQPLYVQGVVLPGKGQRNVVYVATEADKVYAFDADDFKEEAPLWIAVLGTPEANVKKSTAYRSPTWGITSTPVIDLASETLYVLARSTTPKRGYYLHALDLKDKSEKFGGPVFIEARRAGFDPDIHLQRPALLLSKGAIYIGFGSYADGGPYHGWLFAYDATTLKQLSVWNATPTGVGGGLWQSGQGPASDSTGAVFVAIGNGTWTSTSSAAQNYGNSVVKFKLDPSGLAVVSWFTPGNVEFLNACDTDLGSAGPLLLPGSNLLVAGGKEGFLYVLDRTNLGGFRAPPAGFVQNCNGRPSSAAPLDPQVVQSFQAVHPKIDFSNVHGGLPSANEVCTDNHNIHGSPVYWNGPDGPHLYVWGENERLWAYRWVGGKLTSGKATSPSLYVGSKADTKPLEPEEVSCAGGAGYSGGMPGGFLSISAWGDKKGNGILWAYHPLGDANGNTRPGVLYAFDASDVTKLLWHSKQNAARDDVGYFAKFNYPTIANGKVYLATFSNKLVVYGILRP